MTFPRIALVTWCPPDMRYAGGEALRRLVSRMPPEQVRWCSLADAGSPSAVQTRSFVPRALHWRLTGSSIEYFYVNEVQARGLAREIGEWLQPFRPDVVWVLMELAAVNVAWHLHRLGHVPVHATVHDAHELAGSVCVPPLYYPWYLRNVRRLFGVASSVDCISEGLLDHVHRRYSLRSDCLTLVLPPCVDAATPLPNAPLSSPLTGVRRIGVCGSFRISVRQWRGFLALLGELPLAFEVIVLGDSRDVPYTLAPANVTLTIEPYADTEGDVVRRFTSAGVAACYLGVWWEPEKRLFSRTSLSSKLVTYAAAGLPVIVDAPEDSGVWRLVKRYGAGVRIGKDEGEGQWAEGRRDEEGNLQPESEGDRERLMRVFTDRETWRQMAEGARRLCIEEFNLDRNVERLVGMLCRTASRPDHGAR